MEQVLMVYPVAFWPEKEKGEASYSIVVPDVKGCVSVGETVNEALTNVKEALEGNLEALSANHLPFPEPKTVDYWADHRDYKGWFFGITEINVTPYLGRSSKINITLPNLLQKQIEDAIQAHPEYKNRSHFLQYCAVKELEKLQQQDSNRDNL